MKTKIFWAFLTICLLGMNNSIAQIPDTINMMLNDERTFYVQNGVHNTVCIPGDSLTVTSIIWNTSGSMFSTEYYYYPTSSGVIGCVCPDKGILRGKKAFQGRCTDRVIKPPNAARGARLWGVSSLEKDLLKNSGMDI